MKWLLPFSLLKEFWRLKTNAEEIKDVHMKLNYIKPLHIFLLS